MKKILRVSTIAVLAVALVSLSACTFMAELFGAAIMSVSGKAVNVMATVSATTDEYWKGAGTVTLEGATITLTNLKVGEENTKYTAIVGSDGTWTATGVGSGKYTLSGVKDGWTFIPMTIELSGFLTEVSSELLAYPTQDAATIMLIVKWDNPKIDVDSYAVIDTAELDLNFRGDGVYPATHVATVGPGLYSGVKQWPTSGTAQVSLDRDITFIDKTKDTTVKGSLVETIRIASNPIANNSTGHGYLRYYINSYSYYDGTSQVIDYGYTGDLAANNVVGGVLTGNPDAKTFKEGANAVVYIMQGDTLFGTWPLPVNTAENNIAIVSVEFDYNTTTGGTDYLFRSFGANYENQPKALGTIVPVGVKAIR